VGDMRDAGLKWVVDILAELKVDRVDQLCSAKCKAPTKDRLGAWLWSAIITISDYNDLVKKMRDETEALKTQLIGSQQQVVDLQGEVINLQKKLLGSKEEQLATLQTSVRDEMASVQTAVKSELQSWSDIAKRNTVNLQPAATFTPAKLRDAVRSAVEEEDRSRNLVIFNKNEEVDENIEQAVAEVFEDMNERPKVIECRRIGKIQHGKARPIKVKLTSSDIASHILWKAKVLKTSQRSKTTFIGPDRTPEEREVHRDLVIRLKETMKTDTERYHFIRGGKIVSVKKNTGTKLETDF